MNTNFKNTNDFLTPEIILELVGNEIRAGNIPTIYLAKNTPIARLGDLVEKVNLIYCETESDIPWSLTPLD
jgi:hypothetical protein